MEKKNDFELKVTQFNGLVLGGVVWLTNKSEMMLIKYELKKLTISSPFSRTELQFFFYKVNGISSVFIQNFINKFPGMFYISIKSELPFEVV